VKDFAPISLLPSNPYLIVVNKDLPVNNLREFLAYLKANPDKVNMGHPGVGTAPHLLASCCRTRRQPHELRPYRGAAPAMVDLLAGQINPHGRSGAELDGARARGLHQSPGDCLAAPRRPGRRRADRGRGRRAGPAHVAVVRLLGAGRHACADHRQLNAAVLDALGDPAVRERADRPWHGNSGARAADTGAWSRSNSGRRREMVAVIRPPASSSSSEGATMKRRLPPSRLRRCSDSGPASAQTYPSKPITT
jgi:hypothetical protein